MTPSAVSGYVLAGGKSSRMGRDKAFLELAGKPLVAHAVAKLRRLCTEVHVLSATPALAAFAPLVHDLHPGCGPLGGIEAALVHATFDWSLLLPVDVPFLPSAFLDRWVRATVRESDARVALFTVAGVHNPAVLMVHRDLRPCVERAVASGEFKLLPVLEAACRDLAQQHGVPPEAVFRNVLWEDDSPLSVISSESVADLHWPLTQAQEASQSRWFANLNTPEDFAEAERHGDTLDT